MVASLLVDECHAGLLFTLGYVPQTDAGTCSCRPNRSSSPILLLQTPLSATCIGLQQQVRCSRCPLACGAEASRPASAALCSTCRCMSRKSWHGTELQPTGTALLGLLLLACLDGSVSELPLPTASKQGMQTCTRATRTLYNSVTF